MDESDRPERAEDRRLALLRLPSSPISDLQLLVRGGPTRRGEGENSGNSIGDVAGIGESMYSEGVSRGVWASSNGGEAVASEVKDAT